jgi:hypothetical protein
MVYADILFSIKYSVMMTSIYATKGNMNHIIKYPRMEHHNTLW